MTYVEVDDTNLGSNSQLGPSPREVLIFDPALENSSPSPSALGYRFRSLPAGILWSADHILVRGSGEALGYALQEDYLFRELIESVPAPVAGLIGQPDRDHLSPEYLPIGTRSGFDFSQSLNIVRQVEITSLLRQHGSVLTADERSHFILPSGYHGPQFIRIADTLQHLTALRRIAEWILPYVSERSALFADTPSLTPLLLQLRMMKGANIPIGSFKRYPLSKIQFDEEFDAYRYAFPHSDVVFLLSVNSSGKLLHLLNDAKANDNVQTKVIVICDVQDHLMAAADTTVLSRFPVAKWAANDLAKCERCESLHPVLIEPSTFERNSTPVFHGKRLSKQHAEEHKHFWERVSAKEAVEVHYRAPYAHGLGGRNRHFPLYINIPKLLADHTFRQRCLDALRTLPTPSIVLLPNHQGSNAIAELIQEAFERSPKDNDGQVRIYAVDEVTEVGEQVRNLDPDDWVLLADDSIVTGATLKAMREDLQSIGSSGTAWNVNVAGFVALARPGDANQMTQAENPFRHASDGQSFLRYGYKLYLPEPDMSPCPWCDELKMLDNYGNRLRGIGKGYAAHRKGQLRQGLQNNSLLIGQYSGHAENDFGILGSHFGERLGTVAAFAAVSAATHSLCKELASASTGGRIEELEVDRFIVSYMDPVLKAGLLRTVQSKYSRSFRRDQAFGIAIKKTRLGHIGGEQNAHAVVSLAEIGLAIASGKMPRGCYLDNVGHIRKVAPAVDMVCQLIELNLVAQN